MDTTTFTQQALAAAQTAAATFNRQWGGELLRVQPDLAPAIDESALLAYAAEPAAFGWYSTQAIFAITFKGCQPSHGQLIRLGRQLSKRFVRYKDGPRSYYWLAAEGVPPAAWR
jgi:hypothetical protein